MVKVIFILLNNLIMTTADKILTTISVLLASILILGVITLMLPESFWHKVANTFGYWSDYHLSINNVEIYQEVDCLTDIGIIQKGEKCRIYSWQYNGKLMSAHKISCKNGLSGYISISDLKYFPTFKK